MVIIQLSGTATEFIDYAMLVVAILIVYYLLRLIIFLFRGNTSTSFGSGGFRIPNFIRDFIPGGNSGRPGRPSRPGSPHTPNSNGRPPPSFTSELNEIESLINQYRAEFNSFIDYCNDILQTHHEFMGGGGYHTSPGTPVSPEQRQSMLDSLGRLRDLDDRINPAFESITTAPNFARIVPADLTKLLTLTSNFTTLVREMQTFHLDFLTRHSRGDPPAP
jgi:hypothetical protein